MVVAGRRLGNFDSEFDRPAWKRIQPPWWDNNGDLREMQDNMAQTE